MALEEEDGIKNQISSDTITLSTIEHYFDYLSQIGQNEINNYKQKTLCYFINFQFIFLISIIMRMRNNTTKI